MSTLKIQYLRGKKQEQNPINGTLCIVDGSDHSYGQHMFHNIT